MYPSNKKVTYHTDNCYLAIRILARWLGVKKGDLTSAVNRPRYHTVRIPKDESGTKFRILNIPQGRTALVQERIFWLVLPPFTASEIAHAYVEGRDVESCIKPHLYSNSFAYFDFQDAFPSVSWGMLYYAYRRELTGSRLFANMLEMDRRYSREDQYGVSDEEIVGQMARLLAHATIMPKGKGLSQGAQTSPTLMNLVAKRLDGNLIRYCGSKDLVVTRYCDDIVVSSPEEIPVSYRRGIRKIIRKHGFTLNEAKTNYKTGKATQPKIMGVMLHQSDADDALFVLRSTRLPKSRVEGYRNLIHRAETDPAISPWQIKGVMDWCLKVYQGQLPNRLKKPLARYFRRHAPNVYEKYRRVLST